MFPRRTLFAAVLLCMLLVLPAAAADRNELSFSVSCTGFVRSGGAVILNRDNTGTNRERISITAYDGSGNVIFGPHYEESFIGSTIAFPSNEPLTWTTLPVTNPLTVRVVSEAGNNFSTQLVYVVNGYCSALDSIEQDETSLSVLLDSISPSVGINGSLPRPRGPVLSLDNLRGYAISNITSLNMRSGAGPEYTIVGRIRGGTYLLPVARNEDASWWLVEVGDFVGWVNAEYLILRGDLTDLPVLLGTGEIARPTLYLYNETLLQVLPGRSGALCLIPGDLEYYIIGRDLGAEWFEIEATCDGVAVTGWVEAERGGLRNPAETDILITN